MRTGATVAATALLLLLGAPSSHAAPPNPKDDFLRWVNELARAKKLKVCRAGQLRHPGEEAGFFAQLGDPKFADPLPSIWLFAHDKTRWSHDMEGEGIIAITTCDAPLKWEERASVTVQSRNIVASYIWNKDEVTFVGGEPVTLRDSHQDVDGVSTREWLNATDQTVDWEQGNPAPKSDTTVGMLIALPPGSRWIKSWTTPTFVPFGDDKRLSPADADLAVHALEMGKAGVQLVVDITDDRVVPTPARADARRFIRGDHLEIWLADPTSETANRQLGIGLLADGKADVRWLLPKGATEKTPPVRRTGSHVEIDLSLATLGLDASSLEGGHTLPLTVAFSDADDPATRQQTVIATSPVRWNRRWSFGALVWLPSKAGRFPSFGNRM